MVRGRRIRRHGEWPTLEKRLVSFASHKRGCPKIKLEPAPLRVRFKRRVHSRAYPPACIDCRDVDRYKTIIQRRTPKYQVEPQPFGPLAHSCQERNLNGENCKDSRPEKGHGHHQIHRMPQVRQRNPHCEANERSRARRSRRHLHLLLRLRILRKTLRAVLSSQSSVLSKFQTKARRQSRVFSFFGTSRSPVCDFSEISMEPPGVSRGTRRLKNATAGFLEPRPTLPTSSTSSKAQFCSPRIRQNPKITW